MIEIEETLINAMKNAVERGEPLEKVQDSFLNAGYDPNKVDLAASKVREVISQETTKEFAQGEYGPKIIASKNTGEASSRSKIAIVILLLLIIAGIAGYFIWTFKDTIVKWI